MNKIEIPIGKSKILLLLIAALIFVILGILFTVDPEKFNSSIFANPQLTRIIGIVAIVFFGAACIFGVRKLFDKRIGLTIDDIGIIDNTNASSVGRINWSDITEIKTQKVYSTEFLLIYTKNPEQYLSKMSGFKRKLMEGNNSMYGTPLSITTSTIKIKCEDLEKLLNDKWNEVKKGI